MAILAIMLELTDFRDTVKNLSKKQVDNIINGYRGKIKDLPLKRDQHAANMMLDAMIKKMIKCDLTLAYEYAGDLFVTYNKPVPGMSTTEELHALNLRQDAWDNMRRVMVWVESGKIYQ